MSANDTGIKYDDRPISSIEVLKVTAYLNLIAGIILGVYAWQTMTASPGRYSAEAGSGPLGVVISVFCFIWAVVGFVFMLVVAKIAEYLREIKENSTKQ